MDRTRGWPDPALIRTGLPSDRPPGASRARRITLSAIRALDLDEVCWLVRPATADPVAACALASAPSACDCARAPIRATARGASALVTRDTISTLTRLSRRRFVWLMARIICNISTAECWRGIARKLPIAVIARPGYDSVARRAPAMSWLRRFVRPADKASHWTGWRLPALVQLRFRPDPSSATAQRVRDPDWYAHFPTQALRDPLTRRPVT